MLPTYVLDSGFLKSRANPLVRT
ncbi:hypothetical protein RDI58_010782 [Solanum bulbocastanum]|uniref:Uncharacterized protein n=1 Tax=Solanum bulbocastanum TaxID=147425 RepID=A0AAN8TU85_SOLBU